MNIKSFSWLIFIVSALCPNTAMSALSVTLSASAASPSPVGTQLGWTATSAGVDPSLAEYRWSVTRPSGVTSMVIDFDPSNSFLYMPLQDGGYTVTVLVKNTSTNEQASASAGYVATTLLQPGNAPVITATANPLVFIYSAACQSGSMRVFFAPQGTAPISGMGTQSLPCVPGGAVNFLLAGLAANSQYTVQHQTSVGFSLQNGPQLTVNTGSIPGFRPASVQGVSTDPEKVFVFAEIGLQGGSQGVVAFNSDGNMIWAYPRNFPNAPILQLFRPVSGGTMLVGPTVPVLSEIDTLGNVVHQTSAARMNEQLAPLGYPLIDNFNHDAFRLPNGYTAVIVQTERIYTDGTQGSSVGNPVDVIGSGIVVLDQNFQVAWSWNPYTQFDVTRPAVFSNYTCPGAGCTGGTSLMPNGVDLMHGNTLVLTDDGHLLLSLRHQNLILKINYSNGLGAGNILWSLGAGGDFTVSNPYIDPYPWFSGQHSIIYHGGQMTLFDNGITRVDPGPSIDFNPNLCCSRGQVWTLNEATKIATLSLNVSLGTFSDIIGSAQTLINGNYHFLSGFANGGTLAEVKEITPAGNTVFTMDVANSTYRVFRMRDFYSYRN